MTYLPSTVASGAARLFTAREDTAASSQAVLTLSCPQHSGIVHSVSKFLFERGFDIVEHQQFDDSAAQRLYLRTAFVQREKAESVDDLAEDFAEVAEKFSMDFTFHDGTRPRVLVMVSKMGHCLNDLIFRSTTGTLAADLVAVVSNHEDLRRMAESAGLPFIHIPVTAETKPAAEARLLATIDEYDADLIVLARYMQILSPELSSQLTGKAINIHHSFLPGFKGARPYHQAHVRGVKQIGATAHYVTDDLDEGPIIEQEVIRVDHRLSPQELAMVGRDNEALALSKAVRLHVENRVLVDGLRTITFT
ncbi:formyltetrahydrofolate deformylase [Nesterenkonia lutea]|uniref:Formyltetrahydrofolate deformylase n=1 Tax=Nesterenkonia lutea TaxID=272919 RepID=A0ABR9JGF4_9MICC|nr:formyltetrahydrofolate deformylase [Nesterenkonia lutea]MBE1524921.1 formyltetrahydrofolate deformylase [Nesterenkonia lutea]